MARDFLPSFSSDEVRINVLRITSYKDKNIKGYLENPYYREARWFDNLTQMLFLIEETADELNCPQRSNERRSIREKPPEQISGGAVSLPPREVQSTKPIAIFKIHILFRQNASWQGHCEWMEEKKGANFRSALELIQLMDSVLSTI